MRLQDMTFDLDKARVDAAYVGNICLTYEEWPETDNDMQYILAAVYDLEPALDEIERQAARIKELEAEVEAKNKQIKELQDIIDKPPEDADWVADYHLLQSALDGPIIDAARKWHAAYRKAQNSNLMRAKEVERLRSEMDTYGDDFVCQMKAKDARIKDEQKILVNPPKHLNRYSIT